MLQLQMLCLRTLNFISGGKKTESLTSCDEAHDQRRGHRALLFVSCKLKNEVGLSLICPQDVLPGGLGITAAPQKPVGDVTDSVSVFLSVVELYVKESSTVELLFPGTDKV